MILRRAQRALAVVLVAGFTGANAQERKEPARLPPELEQVFGIAMAAPPEFAAGALLRLNTRLNDTGLRRDLIEMAFGLAAKAQNPIRLVAVPGSEVDTRSGSLARALRLRMDALSLQSAAVLQMLAIDPHRARELFLQLPRPSVSPATCDDSLLPDVAPFYELLGALTSRAFTDKERAKGEHFAFARAGLSGLSSVAELAPAASMIAGLDWPRDYFEIALGALTSKLEALAPDSRTFQFESQNIEHAIGALVNRARQAGSDPQPLVETYRKFLVTQLKAPRCSDALQVSGQIAGSAQAVLFGESVRGDQAPLSADESTPEQLAGEMSLVRYWRSAASQKIFEDCLLLRQAPSGANRSDADRRTPEWARQLTDFLGTLADWRAGEESSEADFFHEKATVYEALLELAPPGEMSDRIIESYVSFLKSSNLQQQNAVEWYSHVPITLSRVRAGHPEQAARLQAAFRASGSIVLMLESMLDQVSPGGASIGPAPAF